LRKNKVISFFQFNHAASEVLYPFERLPPIDIAQGRLSMLEHLLAKTGESSDIAAKKIY
jgi:hypothetical protein